MSKDLDVLLDKCIDRMNEGESLEDCLASYPEQAKELEPLLRVLCDAHHACSTMPRATAKSVARQRLDAALVNSDKGLQKRQRRPTPFFGWSRVWATVSIALVLVFVGFGLYWILTPAIVPPVVAQANFRLLVSDQENAIGDFESLEVTITSIGMLRGGEGGGWEVIELEESVVVDLTHLPGLNAQEIWSGILPEGQYMQVFIYIEDAIGTLKNGEGETINVIIPSGNLQISKPFVVGAGDSVVNFVYDVTVVAAGNEYILLPQIDQSGSEQEFHEVGEGALTLWVVEVVDGEVLPVLPGQVRPGESITVRVTFDGSPVEGAQVKVNGVHVGNTSGEAGLEGLISFTVPYDEKLKVKAKINTALGELEGKLRIEFGEKLTIKVVEGVVAPGQNIKVQVTFVTFQGITIPIPGAMVEVNDEEVGTTGDDGRTISFTVPYDDELEIKAVKDELKGKLEIDLEREFQEGELTIQVFPEGEVPPWEGELTPGDSIIVMVTFEGDNVTGALVKVEDAGVFITGGDGRTLPFTVPYEDELEIKAVKDELKGKLEIDLEQEFGEMEIDLEEELTLWVVDPVPLGEVTPGDNITILVTSGVTPIQGAMVTVNDVPIVDPITGVPVTTNEDGLISFTVPDEDEVEIKAVLGELKGKLEIDLEWESEDGEPEIDLEQESEDGELTIQVFPEGEEPPWEGELTPGDSIIVLVTFEGDNVTGALVKVEDVGDFFTGGDGRTDPFIVPYEDEVEIKAVKDKLKGKLEIDLEQGSSEEEPEIDAEED